MDELDSQLPDSHVASQEAVHAAKNLQQKTEIARELQLEEAVLKTAKTMEEAVLSALGKVFSDDRTKSPQEMTVLIQRIPILCTTMISTQKSIEKIEANITWGVRIAIGAIITALVALVMK